MVIVTGMTEGEVLIGGHMSNADLCQAQLQLLSVGCACYAFFSPVFVVVVGGREEGKWGDRLVSLLLPQMVLFILSVCKSHFVFMSMFLIK